MRKGGKERACFSFSMEASRADGSSTHLSPLGFTNVVLAGRVIIIDMEGCHVWGRHTDDARTECEDRARILETEFAIFAPRKLIDESEMVDFEQYLFGNLSTQGAQINSHRAGAFAKKKKLFLFHYFCILSSFGWIFTIFALLSQSGWNDICWFKISGHSDWIQSVSTSYTIFKENPWKKWLHFGLGYKFQENPFNLIPNSYFVQQMFKKKTFLHFVCFYWHW